MIQRIQSIFLFIASLGFFGQFATNFASSDVSIPSLLVDKIYEVQDSPILLGIVILGGLLALSAIFLYSNRNLQSKLAIFSLILAVFLPLVAALLIYNEKTPLMDGAKINDELGIYLPLISIICSGLAMKYINKDEKLVKSMDRLR
jgi:purine-cytosine permease-like protein